MQCSPMDALMRWLIGGVTDVTQKYVHRSGSGMRWGCGAPRILVRLVRMTCLSCVTIRNRMICVARSSLLCMSDFGLICIKQSYHLLYLVYGAPDWWRKLGFEARHRRGRYICASCGGTTWEWFLYPIVTQTAYMRLFLNFGGRTSQKRRLVWQNHLICLMFWMFTADGLS